MSSSLRASTGWGRLQRLSDRRSAEQGLNSDRLGVLLLVQRSFSPEILPMWRWVDGSHLAGGDRVGEIRLGGRSLWRSAGTSTPRATWVSTPCCPAPTATTVMMTFL